MRPLQLDLTRLLPARQEPAPHAMRLRQALALASAPLMTAVLLVAALWRYAQADRFQRASDFIQIGRYFAAPAGVANLATSQNGYDGQFFYYMARFAGHVPPGAIDAPALRYSRMVYPLLIWLTSLGNVALMPWAMLAINFITIVGTVVLLAWVLRERGLPPWLALVAGVYCGQPLALMRDLGDPLAVFWLTVALVGLLRERWLFTAAALGFGMLSRESTLIFVAAFAAPLLLQRRWRMLAAYAGIALGPYVAWQSVLRAVFGVWGFRESSQVNTFVPIPFSGLAAAPTPYLLHQMIIFAGVPAVAAIVLGVAKLAQRPWQDALALGVALGAVAYGLAVVLQPGPHWLDIWEPMRLAAPLAVLLPLLAPRRLFQPAWYGLLGLLVYSITIAFQA